MRPNRLFASSSAVLLLAVLIGCGGGGDAGGSVGGDGSTSGTDGGSTATPVPTGVYATTFTGSNDATPAVAFSGTGTATVAANGTVTLSYNSVSNQTPPASTARTLTVRPTTATSGTGSLVVDSNAAVATTVTVARNSGNYQITSVFSPSTGVTQTDVFALTFTRPAAGTYVGAHTTPNATTRANYDNNGFTYSGAGSASVTANGTVTLDYTSRRNVNGIDQQNTLSTTLLPDGTFSGSLNIGSGGSGGEPTTGTWSLSGNVLTVNLTYVNSRVTDAGYPNLHPTVTETLALTIQP